jgi:hypothetical protein
MKPNQLTITFLSAGAFAVSCKPAAEPSIVENREATVAQFDTVKKKQKKPRKT